MRHRIWIGDFEATFLEVVAKIEKRSADEQGAFRIDHDSDVRGLHHDVAIRRAIHEIHLILEAGASAPNDGHAQGTCNAPLLFQERIQFSRGVLGNFDETLVANLVINGGGWR